MKLNWVEKWVVNNPFRVMQQGVQVRWMNKTMPLPPVSRILEVGCGRGAGAAIVSREFQPSILHAMDLDMEMIRKARKYLSPSQREQIFTYTGDTEHLPYRDGSFDAVFGFGVLHHIPDWRSALFEIARVLKNGGAYYVEEIYPAVYQNIITKHILVHPSVDRFFSQDLNEAMRAAGLSPRNVLELRLVGILGVFVKNG